jgi:ABC-type sulfate transport system permease component
MKRSYFFVWQETKFKEHLFCVSALLRNWLTYSVVPNVTDVNIAGYLQVTQNSSSTAAYHTAAVSCFVTLRICTQFQIPVALYFSPDFERDETGLH